MRKIYRNFINQEDVDNENLLGIGQGMFHVLKSPENCLAYKVIDAIKEDFDFTVKKESYWRVESRHDGHQWHRDTGSSDHMMWCDVGISIILKNSANGGDTYYGDDIEGTNAVKADRNQFDLIAHTSDEWHMVTKNDGKRGGFLMFI